MFQPKIRRALVSAALVSALSLPVYAAAPPSQRSQQTRSEKPVAVRLTAPLWDLTVHLLSKVGVRIDPNGSRLTLTSDPEGNETSSQTDRNN